ncbi:HlyC/CorC family transporter [candidate division KSB1 bacterium]|nr:HlyC/CorC family transporter [candidate division KSB1 bacterium]NIR70075.1 HlyC/CorC family transporter [candidate division KSB1 bacterium]NIS23325.1 HlyC/CorC family transporter [candidate division KSB1 bacterium]NIT70204.1 HlyC/CorC family transporter [candidate division KSB1 bacterium]NIU23856.1 HlyC/CorC family transporter [candidate division KSB1 bacterium]
MEADPYLLSLIFVVLVVLSLLFLGTEAALLSLSDSEREELKKKSSKRSARVLKLLERPRSLFASIKIAVHVINVAILLVSFLLSKIMAQSLGIGEVYALILVLGSAAVILFVIKEFWSNVIVLSYGQTLAELSAFPLMLYVKSVRPFARLVVRVAVYLTNRFGVAQKRNLLAHQRVMAMIENGDETSGLEDSERRMIRSIFQFAKTEVREIMVPRIDMVCVEENTSIEELTELIKEKGHSRIPVYSSRVDNISGILYAKDLLPYLINNNPDDINLKTLARPVSFVPETKRLHRLLKEFQQKKYHMAIVVDEYGGTAGLVTFEDVIEEIVGDIQDEYDQEPPLYRKLDDNTFMVDAKIDLHDLNEKLGFELPTEGEYESLGGFIFCLTGYVPQEKEVVKFENFTFIVESVQRNRIIQVKLIKEESEVSEEV